MVNIRCGNQTPAITKDDINYIVEQYMPGPSKKHKCPVKRLINLKNSTTTHKQRIQRGLSRGAYSQTYCISPGKSYVIEAQGGELNYDIAQQSPQKFYKQVVNQNVKKCMVTMRGKLKWILT